MTGCQNCGHLPHPDRTCVVVRVSGPATDVTDRTYRPQEHTGRDVNPCDCPVYTPTVNGATL